MTLSRLNAYRIMWVLCCFDLPVVTKKDQKLADKFRKFLKEDGFIMIQYSIYARHCPSSENARVHIERIRRNLPPHGSVLILKITDKQMGDSIFYQNAQKSEPPEGWIQLELF